MANWRGQEAMNSQYDNNVFSNEEWSILIRACEKFGFENQCAKAVEEHCELITEVYKYGGKGAAISKIPCNPAPSISSEVADCLIMSGQMAIFEQRGLKIPEIVESLSDHCLGYLSSYTKQFPQEARDQLTFKLELLRKLISE